MMMPDDPWSGLMAGGIDAKRVDPSGRQDFFWIVSAKSEPGLLLRLSEETAEIKPLPKMRNLDIAYRKVSGSNSLLLLLKDDEQRELFGSLCQDIVRAGEQAEDNHDALNRAIRRTIRWHHLLRGGKSDLLTLEEQRGLLGELQFLMRLIDLVGPRAAIETWKGPLGSSKDFELDGCLVEVKARRGAAKPFVQISSEDQLSDVDGCRLFLLVSAIDAVIKPNGMTLTDHVKEVDSLFAIAEPEAYAIWEEAIIAAGFDFEDDYSDRRWNVGKNLQFEVLEGFPRVANPPPPGVSSVRYSISIDACSEFSVDAQEIDELVVERNGSWTN